MSIQTRQKEDQNNNLRKIFLHDSLVGAMAVIFVYIYIYKQELKSGGYMNDVCILKMFKHILLVTSVESDVRCFLCILKLWIS